MKCLDVFCGMGGLSAAAHDLMPGILSAGLDQSPLAKSVWLSSNPGGRFIHSNALGISPSSLGEYQLWLCSPPCQPFSTKGKGEDILDPRAMPSLWLAQAFQKGIPQAVLLENVPPFASSLGLDRIKSALVSGGYHIGEYQICPSQLGIPNRRLRYYLLARKQGPLRTPDLSPVDNGKFTLQDYLNLQATDRITYSSEWTNTHRSGISLLCPYSQGQISSCFTSAYGRQIRKSGSYLKWKDGGCALFTPEEIMALLHFPGHVMLPAAMPSALKYRLVGASVNVAVSRRLLEVLLDTTSVC